MRLEAHLVVCTGWPRGRHVCGGSAVPAGVLLDPYLFCDQQELESIVVSDQLQHHCYGGVHQSFIKWPGGDEHTCPQIPSCACDASECPAKTNATFCTPLWGGNGFHVLARGCW